MPSGVRPVLRYPAPAYPGWDLVVADPGLLAREIPRRWIGKKGLTAALVAAALGVGGCGKERSNGGAKALVACFEHGEGRGGFGCVATTAPYYLGEDEARQVILEELAKTGIQAQPNSKMIFDAIRRRGYVGGQETQEVFREYGMDVNLMLDGYDAGKKIGYEFISEGDYLSVGGLMGGCDLQKVDGSLTLSSRSSVTGFDFAEAARNLAARMANTGGIRAIGIFYEPVEYVRYREASEAAAAAKAEALERCKTKEQAEDAAMLKYRVRRMQLDAAASTIVKRNLRAQVRDFAEWLKGQGLLR